MSSLTHQTRLPRCCAVILSGGLNTRMGGKIKAFLKVGDQTILHRLLASLQPHFEEILLVTRQPKLYEAVPVQVVSDIYTARSSLTGIHAGLVHCQADYAFVVPCDTPFLQTEVIRLLLSETTRAWDVVVPHLDGHYEPLCAIYAKRCLPAIEAQLKQEDYKILNFFKNLRVKSLSMEQLKVADPRLLSFFNVNTPSALSFCQQLVQTETEP